MLAVKPLTFTIPELAISVHTRKCAFLKVHAQKYLSSVFLARYSTGFSEK